MGRRQRPERIHIDTSKQHSLSADHSRSNRPFERAYTDAGPRFKSSRSVNLDDSTSNKLKFGSNRRAGPNQPNSLDYSLFDDNANINSRHDQPDDSELQDKNSL